MLLRAVAVLPYDTPCQAPRFSCDDEVKRNVVEVFTVLTILSQALCLSPFSPLVYMLPLGITGRNLSPTSPSRKAVIGLSVMIAMYLLFSRLIFVWFPYCNVSNVVVCLLLNRD